MRITLVTETYPPEVNGVALTVQSLLGGLLQLGHELTLVRPAQAGEGTDGFTDGAVRIVPVPSLPLPLYPGLRIGLPVTRRLRRLWRTQRPDVVYIATEGPLGWAAARVARRLAIPAATGFHTRFDDFVAHYGMRWLSRPVFAYMRRFHNRAQATLVPTQELFDFLTRRGFRYPRLHRRAVDTRQFDPQRRDAVLRAQWGLGEDGLAVIYLGRIAPEKNLEVAVAAFRAIQSRHPRARFVWVGDGPARAVLERANPGFVFCGMQHGESLGRHFASGDLFLFPSLTETFGNVTLEALASGVVVLAFDYGAAGEHIRNGVDGVTVPFGDAAAFVQTARELADDPLRMRAIRNTARRAVAELGPAPVSRAFEALLIVCSQEQPA
jgi:glycosyltransferase involved in cell wall biosynthesis